MELVVAAVVSCAVVALVALFVARGRGAPATAASVASASAPASRPVSADGLDDAPSQAEDGHSEPRRLHELRADLTRREEALRTREQALDARLDDLDADVQRIREQRELQLRELERISGLSPGKAKQLLLDELSGELRHDSAKLVRQVEEETRHEADRRARNVLSTVMQRIAAGHVAATSVTTVELDSDELKGRIIGREGRNIRTLESLTGVDFIIDDTPGAVVLSGFDGVRREIARVTLEKLLADGRIHPARIEEAHQQAVSEIDRGIVEAGEQAVLEADVGTLHPELTKQLGRLRHRTSYGQNVLTHSIECARLAALLAAELGANARVAARAALMHDMGKAISHENAGPHAIVGAQLARRHGEDEPVAHAIEAHHDEVAPQTVEAVIVQIVDSVSGARPGARGDSLERYVTRLRDLEEIAARQPGVDKVYAMHAGRELRVIVHPQEIDDDGAVLLSREIARAVASELTFPGQIKITVIRESRATDYAQ